MSSKSENKSTEITANASTTSSINAKEPTIDKSSTTQRKNTTKPSSVKSKSVSNTESLTKVLPKLTKKETSTNLDPVLVKQAKTKMERDSFTMPRDEYAQIANLKKRLDSLGQPVKKSELLRAGLKLLAGMDDATLQASLSSVPVIKTGRPKG